MNNSDKKIIGYNPQTGEPIYENVQPVQPKVISYNPQTGEPIYEKVQPEPAQPKVIGYNPQTGEPIYESVQTAQPKVISYNPQTGEPIYESSSTNTVYNYNLPKKSGGKIWLKILIVIIALALIGGLATGLYFTFRGNNNDTEENDKKPSKTINDYEDDDEDDDFDDKKDEDDDDEDDDDSDIIEYKGYEFTKYGNYRYEKTSTDLFVYTSTGNFDIYLNGDSMSELSANIDKLDSAFSQLFDDYTFSKAQTKYVGSYKCIVMEAYDANYKYIFAILEAPGTDYTFLVQFVSNDNTYNYTSFNDLANIIRNAKYVD